jgi:hypothetical protein
MVAGGVADIAKTIAGPAVGFAMAKMSDVIKTQSLYASKHLENIGNGIKTAVTAIQAAPGAVGGALSKMAGAAQKAFGDMRDAGAKAFNSGVLAAAVHPMTAPFVQMADAAKTAAAQATTHVANMAKSVGTAVNTMTVPARTAFAGIAVAASMQANIMADKFKAGTDRIAGNTATAFRNAGAELRTVGTNLSNTFSSAFTGIHSAATTAAGAIKSTFSAAAANLKANFAPAAAAMRETFAGMGQTVAPARAAIGELASSTRSALGSIGKEAGSGLKAAAGGLVDALGGPFGLAIGGATMLVTMYAQSIADSKAKVESLAGTLEKASGGITGATKKMLATNALDGATDKWDDFWRGAMQGAKSTEETLSDLGITTEQYTDKLANPKGRDAYIKGMEAIEDALETGKPITEDMAAAIGSTTEALKHVNGDSMGHLTEKAKNAAEELKRAEEKVRGIAAATGTSTVQAQILSKNFETLASTTSTAADKFTALKNNIDLLNRSSATNANQYKVSADADKAYQQSLKDTADAITAVKEKNNGLVTNLYTVGKGFDFTSQAGRDLHTALEGQTDSILKLGTAAMDKALKGGKSTQEAQKAAISAMQPGIDSLKQSLKDLGFAPAVVDDIVKSFGLVPDTITTALGVTGGDAARQEIFLTTVMADAFKSGNYSAVLAALPDSAKKAIEDATGLAGAFADGNYDAILEALDKTEGGRQQALLRIMAMVGPGAKYEAFVEALDKTGPGVNAADIHIKGVTEKDYAALIKVQPGVPGSDEVERALNWIARNRTTTITVESVNGQAAHPGQVVKQGQVGVGANGGIVSSMSNIFGGKLPLAKAFANGGIENHVAQISRGQTPFRVWSEPESGGEAYVPLAKSKRPRSLKILEEVAEMFGYSLSKRLKFASGGIIKSMPSKSPAVSRSDFAPRTVVSPVQSTSSPTVITNVYPSAGLNEEQVADSVSENIYWKLSTKI